MGTIELPGVSGMNEGNIGSWAPKGLCGVRGAKGRDGGGVKTGVGKRALAARTALSFACWRETPGRQLSEKGLELPQQLQWVWAPQALQSGPQFPEPRHPLIPFGFPPHPAQEPTCPCRLDPALAAPNEPKPEDGGPTPKPLVTPQALAARSALLFACSRVTLAGQLTDRASVLPQQLQWVRAPQAKQPGLQFPEPAHLLTPLGFPPQPTHEPTCR
jgi:hypothetical protein